VAALETCNTQKCEEIIGYFGIEITSKQKSWRRKRGEDEDVVIKDVFVEDSMDTETINEFNYDTYLPVEEQTTYFGAQERIAPFFRTLNAHTGVYMLYTCMLYTCLCCDYVVYIYICVVCMFFQQ
jgi:hypothetical protein